MAGVSDPGEAGAAGSDLRARLKMWKVDGVEGVVQSSTFLFPILSNPIC